MLKFGIASVIASGLTAALFGLAAPAQADAVSDVASVVAIVQSVPAGIDHYDWLDQVEPQVNVPRVDTSVHQSR